jgi:dipeptidyl aminopeptidase/acylaminoacyl peptidase
MKNPTIIALGAPIALALCLMQSALGAGPADRRLTDPHSIESIQGARATPAKITDITSAINITEATLSDDGKLVAFVSNASGRLNLWTMKVSGRDSHQLVHSNERQVNPVFSRDGREIVFAQDSGGDESYDLYAISVNGGEPQNLTRTSDISEFNPTFSPDGAMLAFITKAKGSPTPNVGAMTWPGGAVRPLTKDTDPKANWTPVCWSPDSKYLYAVRIASPDDSDVYRIDVVTSVTENLTRHADHHQIRVTGISPDGKTLLITSNEKQGYFNVALFDLATREKHWVTDTQWEASSGTFSPDGRTFFYELNADGRTTLHFVSTATLKASEWRLPLGLNEAGTLPNAFLPDGSFILSHQDSTRPSNLYLASPSGNLKQLTHNESAGLAATPIPQSQVIVYKSFDGQLVSAFLWVPFNIKRDGTAAAVILPHGGPTDQTVDEFSRRAVVLVSRGFVVLAPNVRGSTGYGMAFQSANIKDLGGADLKDEIAGVEFLKATGFIDSHKVGIWGGSYGGFMTLMAIGKNPNLWAAAVDEYGILNWSTMLTRSDPELQEYVRSLLGDPEQDKGIYENSSPLKYIRAAKAPLLVLQGERDIRVPKEEAEQVVSILMSEGKTVTAVYYPDEGHVFVKRENRNDELNRAVAWFELYLHGKGSVSLPIRD